MKWVILSCGHGAWVPWLEAFPGRQVMCPGPSDSDNGNQGCKRTPQTITATIARVWP